MGSRVIGRETEIAKVVSSLKSSKQLLIYGIDGIGKTTVLFEAIKRLPKNTVSVYFSYSKMNVGDSDEFLQKFGREVLKSYESWLGIGDVDDLYELSVVDLDIHMKNCKLPNLVVEKIKIVLNYHKEKKGDIESAMQAVWGLPEMLAAETGTKCALFLDDVDIYRSKGLDNVRSFGGHITSVLAGRRVWEEFTGESLELKALDKKLVGKDYSYHRGIPLYMTLGKESMPAVELLFVERLKRLSTKERLILFAMAKNSVNSPAEISRVIDYSQTSIRRFLTIMEEKGFVSLRGRGTFVVDDPVFEEWMKKR